MTAICAVTHDGKVWMGGDSSAVAGLTLTLRADPKVFTVGHFLIGYTSSFRMGQLLRWSLVPPAQGEGVDDARFMGTAFIDAVRECLKAGGMARKDNEVEAGGDFLVGYRGQIWEVNSDYQVGQPLDRFAAVGSGQDVCLGALHATPSLAPAKRIRLALRAAERFNAGVRGPFLVLKEP